MSETPAKLRSQRILQRPEWSIQRAVYKSMGYSDHDLERPLIGIANSWNRVVPGHYNLQLVAEYVKQGVFQAGGTPVEFGLIAACDGIAQGHVGMHYILPTRELIANDVEMMVQAHQLDAVVLLGSCDKIVPGLLMAAARLDVPAIVVVGGPMEGGCQFDGRVSDITSLTEALGMLKAGQLDPADYRDLEDRVAPTCGSCSFLGTANTMCCVAEAMGMCLPGSATIPATHAARLRSARRQAGRLWNWSAAASPPGRSSIARGSRTRSVWARRSGDRRTSPCTSRPSPTRRIAVRSPWTCWKSCRAARRTWPR